MENGGDALHALSTLLGGFLRVRASDNSEDRVPLCIDVFITDTLW